MMQIKHLFTKPDKVRIGYSLAFLLLLISLGLTTYSIRLFIAESKMVNHANGIIVNLETIASNIKDAETGFRGYIIMKDSKYLVPFVGNKHKVDSLYNLLKQETLGNYVQQKNLGKLKIFIDLRFEIFAKGIHILNSNNNIIADSLSMRSIVESGKSIMDTIKVLIVTMQIHEKGLRSIREIEMSKTSTGIQFINIASLLVSALLAFYAINTYTEENEARTKADIIANEYRKKLEQRVNELREANEELVTLRRNEKFASTGRIARTIAHEVRNPLTNINLAIEQLKEDIGSHKEELNLLVDIVTRNSARINQLVTDLLNSTKFAELNFERLSINELLDQALEMAADRIELDNITVVKEYGNDICDVEVDGEKIKIAFLNIIINAIEAMEAGKGVLTIRTAVEDGMCITYISDNGHGMDEEALQRLFEPYFTKKAKGNGLGMTNTQNIILNHKGSIRVESALGNGTTFIIELCFPEK